jgi:hypothetical protein
MMWKVQRRTTERKASVSNDFLRWNPLSHEIRRRFSLDKPPQTSLTSVTTPGSQEVGPGVCSRCKGVGSLRYCVSGLDEDETGVELCSRCYGTGKVAQTAAELEGGKGEK